MKCSASALALLVAGIAPGMAASIAPWTRLTSPAGGDAACIVFDGKAPGVAFAGSSGGVIFRSADGGASWIPVQVGSAAEEFRAVGVSSGAAGVVYAYSTGSNLDGSFSGKFYRSADDGLSWAVSASQPPTPYGGGYGRGIAVDQTGQIVVVTDVLGGVFRTADGGQSWSNPLPYTVAHPYGLAADPGNPNVLWVAGNTYDASSKRVGAVWKSRDFGVSWTLFTPAVFNTGTDPDAYAIAVQPGTGHVFATWLSFDSSFTEYGGVARSNDDGKTWTDVDTGILPGFIPGSSAGGIAFDPVTPSTVYLSTNSSVGPGGFYTSTDNGNHWAGVGTSLPAGYSFVVAARPAEAGFAAALFSGSPDILASSDGAASWSASDLGFNDVSLTAIVDDGRKAGGYYGISPTGLVRTTDSGKKWQKLTPWPGLQYALGIAVDTTQSSAPVLVKTTDNFWRSSDIGKTWISALPPLGAGQGIVAIATDSAGYLYATDTGHTLYRSTNDGKTWKSFPVGGASDVFGYPPLAVPGGPTGSAGAGRLYAQLSSGLWISQDYGKTWALTQAQPGAVYAMAAEHVAPYALFVTDGSGAVSSSTDMGASFQAAPGFSGVPYGALATAAAGSQVYSWLTLSALFQSKDGGATATDVGAMLGAQDSGTGLSTLSATSAKLFAEDYDGALFSAAYGSLSVASQQPIMRPRPGARRVVAKDGRKEP